MAPASTESGREESTELDRWSARKVRPVIVLYVSVVFVAFMVLAHFVFHSPDAVKALLVAAVAAIIATLTSVFERVEYRATEEGLEKRSLKAKDPRPFTPVFRWDELNRVVPMRHGFKYVKVVAERRPFQRFWNRHVSDQYSGEVPVERQDLARVLAVVRQQGISAPGPR